MSEEIKADHFKTMEDLLKHLKMWEEDDDYDAYYSFFVRDVRTKWHTK